MKEINPRILMGPGPSPVSKRVLTALSQPTIGHLDPQFLEIMDGVRAKLRQVFNTKNEMTLPISGTGSAGMETCLVNLIEPAYGGDDSPCRDKVLVAVNGVFGKRIAEVARRCGALVDEVEFEWGRQIKLSELYRRANFDDYKLVCVVHAETSTGVVQDLTDFRALADSFGALLVVDAVTSLGGVPVKVDEWGVDAIYSGTQKCLSCPPGLSPVSFSERAMEVVRNRSAPVRSWYLDLSLLDQYWGEGEARVYHHTAPINMIYALDAALDQVIEGGQTIRHYHHAACARLLWEGLEQIGLTLTVPKAERLCPLTTVNVPDGVDEAKVRQRLLEDDGIEIGGGLGCMKGKVWRIGLMGTGCTLSNVSAVLQGLNAILRLEGHKTKGNPFRA